MGTGLYERMEERLTPNLSEMSRLMSYDGSLDGAQEIPGEQLFGYKHKSSLAQKPPDELLKKENLSIFFNILAEQDEACRDRQALWRLNLTKEQRSEHPPALLRALSKLADICSDRVESGEALFEDALRAEGRKRLCDELAERILSSDPKDEIVEVGIEKYAAKYEEDALLYRLCRILSECGCPELSDSPELSEKIELLGLQTLRYRFRKLKFLDPYYMTHTKESLSLSWNPSESPHKGFCSDILLADIAFSTKAGMFSKLPFRRSLDPYRRLRENGIFHIAFLSDPGERLRLGEEIAEYLEFEAGIYSLLEDNPRFEWRTGFLLDWIEANAKNSSVACEKLSDNLKCFAGPAFAHLTDHEVVEMLSGIITDEQGKILTDDEAAFLDAYDIFVSAVYRMLRNTLLFLPDKKIFMEKRAGFIENFGAICEEKPLKYPKRFKESRFREIWDFDLLYGVLITSENGRPEIPDEYSRGVRSMGADYLEIDWEKKGFSQELFYEDELINGYIRNRIPGV